MVKITDRFYINANTNCYTLQEKTTVKDPESKNYGQEVFKDLGYYTSLEGCIQGILKTTTREYLSREEENNIYELQKQIKKASEWLKKLNLDI